MAAAATTIPHRSRRSYSFLKFRARRPASCASRASKSIEHLRRRQGRRVRMAADRNPHESRFRFNSRSQAFAHFDRQHKLILLAGGVGSGKTVLHGLDALERSKTETEVLHA